MKKYQLMTKEEILDAIKSIDGLCTNCICRETCNHQESCEKVLLRFLNSEVELKPRYLTLRGPDDLRNAFEYVDVFCYLHNKNQIASNESSDCCKHCQLYPYKEKYKNCYYGFLLEKVESIK